jgi:hypothetical protein
MPNLYVGSRLVSIGLLLCIAPIANASYLLNGSELHQSAITNPKNADRGAVILIANKDEPEFLNDLFGDNGSPNKSLKLDKPVISTGPPTPDQPTQPVTPAPDSPETNEFDDDVHYGDTPYGIDYINIESFDFGFAIKGNPQAAFSLDIPSFWDRIDNELSHQLIFASPDTDFDAQVSLAITGEIANGRTAQDVANAHALELQDMTDKRFPREL